MEYTEIPEDFKEEFRKKLIKKKKFVDKQVREDPVLFALYYLDIKLRLHQAWAIFQILNSSHKRAALCLARQTGKSTLIAILALWACWYNKFPATFARVTTVYIISRDDDASMKLLYKVRQLMENGDRYMHRFYQKKYVGKTLPNHFTDRLIEPNNTHQITFANGCFVNSLPPTDKVRGNSASMIIIDEAAFLSHNEPEMFFEQAVEPTVAETKGFIIISSTPNGPSGLFYNIFDPEDKKDDYNPYIKCWFPYTIMDDDEYKENITRKSKQAEIEGTIRLWEQEYMASFVTVQEAFFSPEDIEKYFDSNIPVLYEHKTSECSLGIDFGGKEARTVLTIMRREKGLIQQVFQWRSPSDWDINLLTDPTFEHSIQNMCKRYRLTFIVADDCPQGNDSNNWIEHNFQGRLVRHNFRSDQMMLKDGLNRNCGFYAFRSAIKQGLAKCASNDTMKHEMYIVREEEAGKFVRIKAPRGQLCDTVDSAMMAIQPFIGEIDSSMEILTDLKNINVPDKDRTYGRKDKPGLLKDDAVEGYIAKMKKEGKYIPTI